MTSRAAAGRMATDSAAARGRGWSCAVAVSAAGRATVGVLEISLTNPAMSSRARTVRPAMQPIATAAGAAGASGAGRGGAAFTGPRASQAPRIVSARARRAGRRHPHMPG